MVDPVSKPSFSQAAVRDACSGTLVEIYRHVGGRVRKEFCANQCRESRLRIHFCISCLEIHSLYNVQCTSSFTSGASRSAEEAEHSFQQARHVRTHLKSLVLLLRVYNYWKPGLTTKPSFQPDGEVRRGADRGEHDAYSHPRCWHHRR